MSELPFKLGAAYNVFDGTELLEASIRSIRPLVSYVVVVYQTISNFGAAAPASLLPMLKDLKGKGLVDEMIEYTPRAFGPDEKRDLVSPISTAIDVGGIRAVEISGQFFNELSKREIGRLHCLKAECKYFMSMDTDECYRKGDLKRCLLDMDAGNYEVAICPMRHFFQVAQLPTYELRPLDEHNLVAAVFRCHEDFPFRIGCPYPVVVDPTRRLHAVTRLKVYKRSELEMFHFTFVRHSIRSKLLNVSNKSSYSAACDPHEFRSFVHAFYDFDPEVHPTPPATTEYFKECFQRVEVVPNEFEIEIELEPRADALRNIEQDIINTARAVDG